MIRLDSVEKQSFDGPRFDGISINEERLDNKLFISEQTAIKECIDSLKAFDQNIIESYADGDVGARLEYIQDLHSSFSDSLWGQSKLQFEPMSPFDMGYHNPELKVIAINEMLLEDSDPREIILTDLHEIRHDFQNRAVNMPYSVDVDKETINLWKDNFDNYISPELDFEAYYKQPVEVDARTFASMIYDNAINK